jgi:EAL domain-containing protein (putative c-di-GMP-specific phosphodiesterase class I)
VAPPLFVVAPYLLAALGAATFVYAYDHRRTVNMAYAALNVVLILYATVAFIGVRNSIVDAWIHFKRLLYKPAAPRRRVLRRIPPPVPPPPSDWRTVLQLGAAAAADRAAPATPTDSSGLPDRSEFRTVFQPVVRLDSGAIVGYEALTRFTSGVSAERWLADAVAAGTGPALERLLADAALEEADGLPGSGWLAVKASPRVLAADPTFVATLAATKRVLIVEVTEPSTSDLTPELRSLPDRLPPNVLLAVEHAGLGHKTLAVLVQLRPAFVKLDRAVVAGVGQDPARQTQLETLVRTASKWFCSVIASGIETDADLRVLQDLGIPFGQGFLVGEPKALVDA